MVYFQFTTAFLDVPRQQPGLVRLFRVVQAVLATYVGIDGIFCFLTDAYRQPIHEGIHTLVRVGLVIVSLYVVPTIYRRNPIV